ncbi:F-box/FBD-like domains containing protein [Rhynchospora pubera]|uniref:F-box/FBD-like domains containing protein n=1 Tax=Rhynchospora pubera TaxID=906938 RepID=A0AAV8EZ57_9POAL|nr:F-box/FBD-like domains containing protein [Rhynchospora pubera]
MAISPIHQQIDRLSSLPDELLVIILSFLPVRAAARTSMLSRRFRHLFGAVLETSPSLELISRDFPHRRTSAARFITTAEQTLLRRSPSRPLPCLRLELSRYLKFSSAETDSSFLPSLFIQARSLGVRRLTIEGAAFSPCCLTLPLIFSITSLEFLSLPRVVICKRDDSLFPSAVALTNLKSLSMERYIGDPFRLNQLLSQLCSLEDFSFELGNVPAFELFNQTIRRLKIILSGTTKNNTVMLSLPSLELLHVQYDGMVGLPHIYGDVPSLQKAVLNLSFLRKKDCSAVAALLTFISHAKELILLLKENDDEMYPFPILMKQGKDLPNFPDLKHLNVTMCFHKYNFKAIVMLLRHALALESLKLVHKVSLSNSRTCARTENDWRSMLPRNARKVFYTNLHLGQHNKDFLKLVGKQCSSSVVEQHH